MNHDVIWGAALIAYAVPWAIWAARQPDVVDDSKPANKAGLGLAAGFLAILILGWATR